MVDISHLKVKGPCKVVRNETKVFTTTEETSLKEWDDALPLASLLNVGGEVSIGIGASVNV